MVALVGIVLAVLLTATNVAANDADKECIRIYEEFGVSPYMSWGRANQKIVQQWNDNGCNQRMCSYWHVKYAVQPFQSWGSLPVNLRTTWDRNEMQCNFRVGPYNIDQCIRLSEEFNLVPYVSWGKTPDFAKPLWDAGGCNIKMCDFWRKKYGVKPFESWGSMPSELQKSWDQPAMQCSYRTGPFTDAQCIRISEDFGLVPWGTWGKTPEFSKSIWTASECDHKLCAHWKTKYNVTAYESWGSLPENLKNSWDHPQMMCSYRVGPYNGKQCAIVSEKFDIIPKIAWGTTPNYAKPLWKAGKCDQRICEHWKSKYGVEPYKTFGTMPKNLQASWSHPKMHCDLLRGSYNSSSCRQISDMFGVIPYISWGNSSESIRPIWDASDCNPEMCQYWKEKYKIKLFEPLGKLPENVKASWVHPKMKCDFRLTPYTDKQCVRLYETYGLIPYQTWGKTPDFAKPHWDDAGCNQKMCQHWKDKHNVKPFHSWGNFPISLKPSWEHTKMQCDFRLGPYSMKQCAHLSEKFGLIPYENWGQTPDFAKNIWDASDCNQKMCLHWREKYNINPNVSIASLPSHLHKSWNHPKMSCSTRAALISKEDCIRISEKSKVIPYVSWGNTNGAVRNQWRASKCDVHLCAHWKRKFKIEPFKSWGKAPANVKTSWEHPDMNCNIHVGPYNSKQCAHVSEKFGLVPHETWGKTPNFAKPLWTNSGCDQKMCQVWKDKYKVVAYKSLSIMPKSIQAAWTHPKMQCNLLEVSYNASMCAHLHEKMGVIPQTSWGTLPDFSKRVWQRSKCDEAMCSYWRRKYGIKLFKSNGTMPDNLKKVWNHPNVQCDFHIVPYSNDQCIHISEKFGMLPYRTWGKTPQFARPRWDSAKCNQKMCQYWKDKYGVKPFDHMGTLPYTLLPSWNHSKMQCNYRVANYSKFQCAHLSEEYGLIPYFTLGKTPAFALPHWNASGCNQKMCQTWQDKYGVKPFESWGKLPDNLKKSWEHPKMMCNYRVGSFNKIRCIRLAEEFGLIPTETWGKTPKFAKPIWEAASCDLHMCQHWKDKYNVTAFESFGSMPANLQKVWKHHKMKCNYRVGPYNQKQCVEVAKAYQIKPKVSWGTALHAMKTLWKESDCDRKMCKHWEETYGKTPHIVWTKIAPELKLSWLASGCFIH